MRGKLISSLIAVDVDDAKLALARKNGVNHTINPKNEDLVERVKEITGGHMADFVVEGTGNTKVLDMAAQLIRVTQGRVVLMSSHEEITEKFDFRSFITKGGKLLVPHPAYSLNQEDDMRRAVELINNGTFDLSEMITHRFKLDDIQKAFESLEHKPAGYIKGEVIP
jgi:threonine dehydrogenase-like Zn-dependent dehydrogenase